MMQKKKSIEIEASFDALKSFLLGE